GPRPIADASFDRRPSTWPWTPYQSEQIPERRFDRGGALLRPRTHVGSHALAPVIEDGFQEVGPPLEVPVKASLGYTEAAAQIRNVEAVQIVVDQEIGRRVDPVGRRQRRLLI